MLKSVNKIKNVIVKIMEDKEPSYTGSDINTILDTVSIISGAEVIVRVCKTDENIPQLMFKIYSSYSHGDKYEVLKANLRLYSSGDYLRPKRNTWSIPSI